jgi:carboxylesterase
MPSLPGGFTRKKPGNRKAALLLHGMSSSPWEMSLLASALVKSGWDVYCPLLADFRTWEGRFDAFSWRHWASAAERDLALMKGRYSRTAVVGTSLGGVLAGWVCASHPWIGSAVMVNPPFRYRGFLVHLALLFPWLVRKVPVRIAPALRAKYFPYFPIQAVRELGRLACEVTKEAPRITQDVLVYHCVNDRTVSAAGIGRFLGAVSSKVKGLRRVEKGPHSLLAPYYKNNGVFMDEILDFIGSGRVPGTAGWPGKNRG